MIRGLWVFSLLTGAFLLIAAFGGCGTAPVVVRGDSYCRLAKPISWSVRDTADTSTQVRKHNAVRRRVCG
jgi:hypothetical protein